MSFPCHPAGNRRFEGNLVPKTLFPTLPHCGTEPHAPEKGILQARGEATAFGMNTGQ